MGKVKGNAKKTGSPPHGRAPRRRRSGSKRSGSAPEKASISAGADRGLRQGASWRERSVEELAAEQGVGPVERFEDVWGRHADLWESDDEFERFVNGIYERRHTEVPR